MHRDDPERMNSHRHQLGGGVEHFQKNAGDELERNRSAEHDADGKKKREAQSLVDPGFFSRTVVVGKNRNQTVVQTEDGHEEEALELEIDTKHSRCGGGEANQNQIHEIGHHGPDGHHKDGRNTNKIDFADDGQHRMENLPQGEVNVLIISEVQEQSDAGCHTLTKNRGISGSCNPELRKSAETEDQDRIEDDIEDGTGHLADHGQDGHARGLQKTLKGQLEEKTDGEGADNPQIGVAGGNDFRNRGLALDKQPGDKKADEDEGDGVQKRQKQTVSGSSIGAIEILLTK